MRLHRFITKFNVSGKKIALEDKAVIRQIKDVLRLKTGDTFLICENDGEEFEVEIDELEKNKIDLKIIRKSEKKETIKNKVHLYMSVVKKDNFEVLAQKCVEVGVESITPIISERTIKTNLPFERINKIMHEATEQSGQNKVVKLNEILDFENALKDAKEKVFDIYIAHTNLEKIEKIENKKEIAIFIGPEGGFSDKEIELAKKLGGKTISLGGNILRAETAAIIASWFLTWNQNQN